MKNITIAFDGYSSCGKSTMAKELAARVGYTFVDIVLVVLVLLQEGKSQGLGAIQGSVENTYWGKNKGRSSEGMMKK